MENKVTTETAETEFFVWCEANEIETDSNSMSDDETVVFNGAKAAFVKAIKAGRCVIDGLKVTYTISKFSPENFKGTDVEFSRPSGNIWLGMDGLKTTDQMHKMQRAMCAMTGKDVGFFAKLDATLIPEKL